MRFRDKIICFTCIIIAAVFLIAAGSQLDYINSERQRMKLIINEPLENAPPSLAFTTVAMGAFRGLVVDVLWLRAEKLKEEGQFFDAKQIAEWITALQPRFASVWEFQSWNMAYNISVAIPATQPEQRWKWVKNGYELLRDKGIPLNPRSILLYRQMAWIFQHKIGGLTDDAHNYYKLQLATAMESLLGKADKEYFKALAEAPTNLKQVVADQTIAEFVNALKTADKTFAEENTFVANYLSLRQNPARFNPEAFKIIDNYRGTKELEKFDIFAKAYQLRNHWKLDPVVMQKLNGIYGPVQYDDPNNHLPLDWRHPDVHAIYWAVKGLEVVDKDNFSIDQTNTNRIVNHSLQNLFRYGKIFIYDRPVEQTLTSGQESGLSVKILFLRPDLRMFEPYNKSVMKLLQGYKKLGGDTYVSFQTGHRNMLINALFSSYQAGHRHYAQKIYNQARKLYPDYNFGNSLVTFVRRRLREELRDLGLKNATEMIQMMLQESYFRFAMHDDDIAANMENMAKEIYQNFRADHEDDDRMILPEFPRLRYFAILDFFYDQRYPVNLRRALIGRIKLERPKLAEQLAHLEASITKPEKGTEAQKPE